MTRTGLAPAVRRLFEELIELAPGAHAARLARVRLEDPTLAEEVAVLLAAAAEAPEFLERPARESELVGHVAGPWRIEARLSAGGDAEVYRARRADGRDDWHVALKVLRRGPSGPDALRRFEAERRALAALDHPYIVPLIDAGTLADGRSYLATRLIEGVPLDVAARALPLRARLRLFLEVARAVQHAHARLVLHCDLKPENVLVTPGGIPQLVDFGIARVLGGESAERALTPGYASPEQLAGAPLGVASDVWSLGVVLYELVTGRRPFAGPPARPAPPASRAVTRAELSAAGCPAPEPPARLARRLRGDLDALLARALALDPAERYPSVEALARDVEDWLARRPIAARPSSAARRAWLWTRRNPATSVAGLAFLLALLAGSLALRRDLQRSRAEASLGWRAHAQAVLAARWIEGLARAAGDGPALERALDDARARLASEADFPPEGEGRLRMTLGALFLEVGRPRDAETELQRALELARETPGFGRQDVERMERLLAEARALGGGRSPVPRPSERVPGLPR
ncbi:MAG TPA: serine/threonine-protein kinase [Planctomycetota bacterium]